jgi:predicted Zn finger-like uncharacterized protein
MEIKCPECGFARQVPEDKIPPSAKTATCPKCGQKFFFRYDPEQELQGQDDDWQGTVDSEERGPSDNSDQPVEEDIWTQLESLSDIGNTSEHEREDNEFREQKQSRREQFHGGVPWERLSDYGFFPALIETIKLVMFQPQEFFARLSLGQGYSKPLIFYLLVAEIQALAQFMWRMAGVAPQMGQQGGDFLGFGLAGLSSLLVLILYPVFLAGMLFVVSALNHACLMAVKAGNAGYEGTFKVISYSNAPMVLAVLPLFGPLVGMVWTMVCTFLGFKYVHRTTNMRVLWAMLLPLLVVLVLSMLLVSARGVG